MRTRSFYFALLWLLLLPVKGLLAQISTAQIFGSNMVLQRDKPIRVWGRAKSHERVTVRFHGQKLQIKADRKGHWEGVFNKEKAGGPYEMIIEAKSGRIAYQNILIGDLWVCSGQSNMEFPVSGWAKVDNYEKEIAAADHPMVRLFTVEKDFNTTELSDLKGGNWEVCSPETISPFSAVGYFFGRAISEQTKVPIGLINSTWGGTDIETWISREGLDSSTAFKEAVLGLPVLDLDSLRRLQEKMALEKVKSLQDGLPNIAETLDWKSPDFEDENWPKMTLPVAVENTSLGGSFDGEIWFRKEIDLQDVGIEDSATLSLSMIDDQDDTYVNGIRVGGFDGYNQPRVYTIQPGVLKNGINQIAIKVTDGGGGGGVLGYKEDMYLELDGTKTSIAGEWRFKVAKLKLGGGSFGPNSYPSLLYNAMIHPITGLGIKGVIWYQGENNASRAYEYRWAMPLLIKDWRRRWNMGEFPFYFVQLSSFDYGGGDSNNGSSWAELREAQSMTLDSVACTGMAVTTDIGNPKDIHPTNKLDVGSRLAALALNKVYHLPVVFSGPVFKGLELKGEGTVQLSFDGLGGGLLVKGDTLKGFEIAGDDKHFYAAKAVVVGDKVQLFSDRVDMPVAVRYNWA